jgi:serine/threonine-protein kinase RsbW
MLLLERKLECRIESLPGLLDAIEGIAGQHGWPDSFRTNVLLVVEELVVNAISYGGRTAEDGWVTVRLLGTPEGLSVEIADNGVAFDPLVSTPEPSLDQDLESRAVGGLGVFFVRELTDSQRYERINDENRIALFKYWQAR